MTKGYFERVYEIVRKIPKGKVMTYGQIAEVVSGRWSMVDGQDSMVYRQKTIDYRSISPQLVGWALHANKDEKTPCHRVVDKTGRIAPNFAFDGWREQKRRLEAEGVDFKDEMHVWLNTSPLPVGRPSLARRG